MTDYLFRDPPPRSYQLEDFLASRDREAYALFWEMSLGKTRTVLDTSGWLYVNGRILGLLVICKNGGQYVWREQAALYLPEHVPHTVTVWQNSKLTGPDPFEISEPQPLRILVLNKEAIRRSKYDKGYTLARRFLAVYASLMAIDESQHIKTPGASQTKRALVLGKYAKYRRIMTGTQITRSPFDVYAPCQFLDSTIIPQHSFLTFKHEYGRFEDRTVWRWDKNKGEKVPQKFEELQEYRNVDRLIDIIRPHASIRRKCDHLNLPEKLRETVYVPFGTEQAKLYKQLLDEGVAVLGCTPEEYEAALIGYATGDKPTLDIKNPLAKMTRLSQLVTGLFVDDEKRHHRIPHGRIEALTDVVESTDGGTLVWCRYRHEVEETATALAEHGEVVQYHGDVSPKDREAAVKAFGSGAARFFVATLSAAAESIDGLQHAAQVVIYYSHDPRYGLRVQSEDRAHRPGLKQTLTIVDLVAPGTTDERILADYKVKQTYLDQLMTPKEATA